MATARELVLWLLEAGHTPQHLSLNLSSGAALEQAITLEVEVLQSQGHTALAANLYNHSGHRLACHLHTMLHQHHAARCVVFHL